MACLTHLLRRGVERSLANPYLDPQSIMALPDSGIGHSPVFWERAVDQT